jgi:micrococcal nuclease
MTATHIIVAAVLIISASTVGANPTILEGTVTKVRDGDTIEVGRIPIRLNGVSAPEMNEPLGPKAKAFMADLVMGKRVRCELDGSSTHDRFVGACYLHGRDIGEAVIKAGLALDCPRYSRGRYRRFEVDGVVITLPGYCK